jgi:ribonuclease HII
MADAHARLRAVAVATRRKISRPGRKLLRFDRALGSPLVAGADEAGRGALAGPLVTAAVLLDHDRLRGPACAALGELDDSKQRTRETRERLLDVVLSCAVRVSVIVIPACEIDRYGLHRSNLRGLARALEGIEAPEHALLLVDGFRVPLSREHRAIIDGDAKSAAIAAASIVAKVTRDRLMRTAHARHPQYGFDGHVGYGTPAHRAALREHGPCVMHRRSFACFADGQLQLAV